MEKKKMNKEELFIQVKMWVEKDEDDEVVKVRLKSKLPQIDSELVVELYRIFFEGLCDEISTLDGAEHLVGAIGVFEEEDEDAAEE
jgi:hypothetical protein